MQLTYIPSLPMLTHSIQWAASSGMVKKRTSLILNIVNVEFGFLSTVLPSSL
nr:MAG TPA: hypothetical protein [Caudoviricetes sp.]